MKALAYILSIAFVLVLGAYFGYMYGAKDELGLANDREAVKALRLPRARFDYSITKGRIRNKEWRMVTLENNLECVVVGNGGGAYDSWGACNFEKWNAEKEKAAKTK